MPPCHLICLQVNEYRCECAVGWTGSLCDADIDECAANQCQNGATCTDLIGNYSCSCLAGFAGSHLAAILTIFTYTKKRSLWPVLLA